MSCEEELRFMEVTGCDPSTAARVMEVFQNNLQDALSNFFDNPDSFLAHHGGIQQNKRVDVTSLAPPTVEEATRSTVTLPTVEGTPEYTIRAILSWAAPGDKGSTEYPLQYEVCGAHLVGHIKQKIFDDAKIPCVVQRCVFQGENLTNNVKMSQIGLRKKPHENEIAILFPRRDEKGPISIVAGDGKQLFELKEGEWNVSTSISKLRQTIAKLTGDSCENIRLVFNALSLEDNTSFGQNGIHAFATIFVFEMKESLQKGKTKRK